MSPGTAAATMPAASRVLLVPPAAWGEEALLQAVRAYAPTKRPARPGDEVSGLVVVGVEPAPGATVEDATEIEVLPTPRAAEGSSVDLLLLLDVSESMGTPWSAQHTRLEAARESIAAFLRAPGRSVATLAILEYAKEARVVAGPAPPASVTLPAATRPKGRSLTATALDAALAHLAASARPNVAQAILLLTDGVGEVEELRRAAERAARLRIPVHAIVFAPEMDEVFDELAQRSGGTAQRAALPLTLEFEHQPGGTSP